MRALLLAAGRGTRLGEITRHTPKCLVKVGDTPLLDIWIHRLAHAGFTEVLLNTHYLAPAVDSHVRNAMYPIPVLTSFEPELLGTAGTIEAHKSWLESDDVLVAHADNFALLDIPKFVIAHRERSPRTVMTMLAFHTDTPETCGILETDAEGVLQAMWEKSKDYHGTLANAAVYMFSPELVREIRGAFDFSLDVIPKYFGRIQVVTTSSIHIDIGNPEALARAQLHANEITL